MIENRKILITGGCGFIGTSVAEKLVDSNEIILYDLNLKNNAFGFSKLVGHPNVTLVEGDILDSEKLRECMKDVNIVLHLAAIVGVQNVLHQSLKTLETNFQGTASVLNSLPDDGIERFVYLSTSEVFGSNAYCVSDNDNSNFGSTDEGRWCYAISKIASEHLVQAYNREKGLPTVIIRPFNIFGPKRVGDHAILRFIYWAIHDNQLIIHGNGEAIRSWCYIDDFCDAIISCLEKPEAIGHSFNIGNSRNTLTMYELAKRVIQLCNSRSTSIFKAIDYSDVQIRVPNTLGAYRILGYEPKVEIEEGILRTKAWYEEHFPQMDISFFGE
ncbi:MAG: NAD-dependent epimerase/dehydratase family protein [Alphaproteobacteria bacterium]|nr:MAG: NAD-dependent epimerase/dehydratase family protein [Alphaproteobacteria bacterium]